jgi:hypothetical protein
MVRLRRIPVRNRRRQFGGVRWKKAKAKQPWRQGLDPVL